MGEPNGLLITAEDYQTPEVIDLRVPVPRRLMQSPVEQAKRQRRLVRGILATAGGLAVTALSGWVAYSLAEETLTATFWMAVVASTALTRTAFHWLLFRGEVSRSLGLTDEVMGSLRIATAGSLVGVLTALVLEALQQADYPMRPLVREWAIGILLWATYLVVLKILAIHFRRRGRNTRNVLVIGGTATSRRLIEHVSQHPETGYRIAGVVPYEFSTGPSTRIPHWVTGEEGPTSTLESSAVLTRPLGPGEKGERDLPSLISELSIDDVVFAAPVPPHQVIRLLSCSHPALTVSQVSASADAPTLRTGATMAGFPVIDFLLPSLRPSCATLKRAVDLPIAAVGLIVTGPILVLSALLIRLTSRGPALFKQTRIGQHGRPFTLCKLRTMKVDSDSGIHEDYVRQLMLGALIESSGGIYKMERPEVTSIGRWLRRFSIDELPQLLNVLNGSMSIVGPRPPMLYEIPMHDSRQLRRLDVKPGLTGLWQVSARSNVGYREMIELDLQYIAKWSLTDDFRIILQTPAALFRHRATS